MTDKKHTGGITPDKPFHVGEDFNSLQGDKKPTEPVTTEQKETDPFWPFKVPPKPIERDQSIEEALWKNHIEPIVKKHDLRNLSGERFKYQFIEKQINERHVHLMVKKTTIICLKIEFPEKVTPPIHEKTHGNRHPDDCRMNFTIEFVCHLRDAEKGKHKRFRKDGVEIDFRDIFRDFLEDVFRNETLPEFLEMLRDDGLSAETDPDLISTEDEESRLLDSSGVFHPPPPGTKWEDVKITLTASDTVRIETPHGKGKYTYHTLGMADGRRADKSKEVWTTFSLFAVNHGVVPQKGAITFIDNLTEKAKRLNKHLKDLFKINDPIFKHNFKKYHRYETKIVFSNQTEITVPQNEHAESAFELGTEDTKNFTNESTPWN